ncbi:hypothetical protein EYV94_20395 [Puteibacter caeruleilacunae]|nr:hypothetical protein EYV94_20395 [Puteibacter caeruleilacunae]
MKNFVLKALALSVIPLSSTITQANAENAFTEKSNKTNADKPNFIVLLGDDISAVSFGCYGSPNSNTSPHIDKLAKEGVMFTNMFVSEAICAPARAELYTGLQPLRNGCYVNHHQTVKGTKSIVHYLSELGYRVGLSGKTHFSPKSVYPFEMVDGLPHNCNARNIGVADWSGIEQFIQKDKDQPFCIFLCSVHAHSPWDSGDPSSWKMNDIVLPPNLVDTRETRLHYREYLAEVRLFDDQVGRVQKMMKRLKLDENTVFIVLDENGTGMPGGKWSNYDWGVRSACLMKWPASYHMKQQNTKAIAQYCDIVPTMIDAAGGKTPINIDGKSLMDVISGKEERHRDYAFFTYNSGPVGPAYPIRAVTDGRYKLIWNLLPDTLFGARTINGFEFGYKDKMLDRPDRFIYLSWQEKAKTDDHAKSIVTRYRKRPEYELYDLDKDPWELNNLADQEDKSKHLLRLKAVLEKWRKEQGDKGILAEYE